MDNREFSIIIEETRGTVLSAVQRYLPAHFHSHIDDVVQETYFRAYRAIVSGKFKSESALSTWLYAIARNESIRMSTTLVREQRKAEKAKKSVNTEPIDERDDILTEYIAMLDDEKRDVLKRQLEGKEIGEIARELGVPEGTVKSRLHRAKAALRAVMVEG